MKGFADLADLPEDRRIAIIGRTAAAGKDIVFVVDDDVTADRYITKLLAAYRVRVITRGPGPVTAAVFVRIGQAES